MDQYRIIPLLQGVPVTSNRGALGWSSSTLIQGQGRSILFDTGSYGDRPLLLSNLASHGLGPDSFDLVVLSHFHFDHIVNAEILPRVPLALSRPELEYISSGQFKQAEDPFVPLAHIHALATRFLPVDDRLEIAPGVQVVYLPGHTPGSMGLWIQDHRCMLTGDAVKNSYELAHNIPPPCFGTRDQALASMHRVRTLASWVLPGHDLAFPLSGDDTDRPEKRALPVHLTLFDRPDRPRIISLAGEDQQP